MVEPIRIPARDLVDRLDTPTREGLVHRLEEARQLEAELTANVHSLRELQADLLSEIEAQDRVAVRQVYELATVEWCSTATLEQIAAVHREVRGAELLDTFTADEVDALEARIRRVWPELGPDESVTYGLERLIGETQASEGAQSAASAAVVDLRSSAFPAASHVHPSARPGAASDPGRHRLVERPPTQLDL